MAAEQVGNPLLFVAYFRDASSALVTGLLDVVFTVYRDGVVVVSGQPAVAAGSGYSYTLPGLNNTVEGNYWAEATTASASVVQKTVPVAGWQVGKAGVENLNSPISGVPAAVWSYVNRTLTSVAPVQINAPLNPLTGVLTIIRGDNYEAALSRSISWTDGGDWPDLTSAVITFKVQGQNSGKRVLSVVMTYNAGPPQAVRLDLTSDQTALLSSANAPNTADLLYEVRARLTGGELVTLVTGNLTVRSDLR